MIYLFSKQENHNKTKKPHRPHKIVQFKECTLGWSAQTWYANRTADSPMSSSADRKTVANRPKPPKSIANRSGDDHSLRLACGFDRFLFSFDTSWSWWNVCLIELENSAKDVSESRFICRNWFERVVVMKEILKTSVFFHYKSINEGFGCWK